MGEERQEGWIKEQIMTKARMWKDLISLRQSRRVWVEKRTEKKEDNCLEENRKYKKRKEKRKEGKKIWEEEIRHEDKEM